MPPEASKQQGYGWTGAAFEDIGSDGMECGSLSTAIDDAGTESDGNSSHRNLFTAVPSLRIGVLLFAVVSGGLLMNSFQNSEIGGGRGVAHSSTLPLDRKPVSLFETTKVSSMNKTEQHGEGLVGDAGEVFTEVQPSERTQTFEPTKKQRMPVMELGLIYAFQKYEDYSVEWDTPENMMNFIFGQPRVSRRRQAHYGSDLNFADALKLYTLGRLTVSRSKSRAIVVNMGERLGDGQRRRRTQRRRRNAQSCPSYWSAKEKMYKQFPDIKSGDYHFLPEIVPNQVGSCHWSGLANLGCIQYPEGGHRRRRRCSSRFRHSYGGGVIMHELGHNLGLRHNKGLRMREADQSEVWANPMIFSDPQQMMDGTALSIDRAALWYSYTGILRDQMPDVFTWEATHPTSIGLASMSLPFDEFGAAAACARIRCPCCTPLEWGDNKMRGGNIFFEYRGTTGHFGLPPEKDYYKNKVLVHYGVEHIPIQLWAVLMPGEVYNVPNSSLFVHFCPKNTDSVADVSFAFSPGEARKTCPGSVSESDPEVPTRLIALDNVGFHGLVCSFPFVYSNVVHKDCFSVPSLPGRWCVSGRVGQSTCDENFRFSYAVVGDSFVDPGHRYKGCQNKTRSGRTCQPWEAQTPHKHGAPHYAHNYCRNPVENKKQSTWCYTTDPERRWEFCEPLPSATKLFQCKSEEVVEMWGRRRRPAPFPLHTAQPCSILDGTGVSSSYPCQCGSVVCRPGRKCTAATSECSFESTEMLVGTGSTYRGTQNVTRQGYTCMKWTKTGFRRRRRRREETRRRRRMTAEDKSDPAKCVEEEYTEEATNYCRNPENSEKTIWCFVDEKKLPANGKPVATPLSPKCEGRRRRCPPARDYCNPRGPPVSVNTPADVCWPIRGAGSA